MRPNVSSDLVANSVAYNISSDWAPECVPNILADISPDCITDHF